MKETPLLFNGEMVRAILSGQKTQTRRIVSQKHLDKINTVGLAYYDIFGDRIWVRETFSYAKKESFFDIFYRATDDDFRQHALHYVERENKWRPSIHMPREASRINLDILNIRIERLNDISEEDAIKEGIANNCSHINDCDCHPGGWLNYMGLEDDLPCFSAKDSFKSLWQSMYDSWDENPWVWVIEFKKV